MNYYISIKQDEKYKLEKPYINEWFFEVNEKEYNKSNAKEINMQLILNKQRINELKKLLQESDYKAIKYAEGLISDTDYQPIKELRQSYREEINELGG